MQLASLDAYARLLGGGGADGAEAEWRQLENLITIGETYFFRYADHFQALRETILPNLIAKRAAGKHLRVWSIGCSTGAEPYSVAILIRELLGDQFLSWRVAITGGDISEAALNAARAARYGAWALRTLSDADKARYFERIDPRTWALKRDYKFVRFERQNILDLLSPAPPLAWTGYDLILCRNVLIYFSPDKAVALTKSLKQRLNEEGSLLLGHAEATLDLDPNMVLPLATEFEQTRRGLSPAPWMPAPLPDAPIPHVQRIAPLTPTPASKATLSDVRAAADAGDYERAHALAKQLIGNEPLSASAHYYDALISLVADGAAEAEVSLRRALYLNRGFAIAHHRLALILLSQSRIDEARRALKAAIDIAKSMPVDALMPEGEGVTAGDFVKALVGQLKHLEAAA